jgi:hypothetical protein
MRAFQRFWIVLPMGLLPARSMIREMRKVMDRTARKMKRTISW